MGAVQIKNVPEELHDKLRARAKSEGMSVSEYLLKVINHDLARLTNREWFALLETREPVLGLSNTADLIREWREDRDDQD